MGSLRIQLIMVRMWFLIRPMEYRSTWWKILSTWDVQLVQMRSSHPRAMFPGSHCVTMAGHCAQRGLVNHCCSKQPTLLLREPKCRKSLLGRPYGFPPLLSRFLFPSVSLTPGCPRLRSSKKAVDRDLRSASASYVECLKNFNLLPPKSLPLFDHQLYTCKSSPCYAPRTSRAWKWFIWISSKAILSFPNTEKMVVSGVSFVDTRFQQ